jgi:hypothetical protein
MGLAAQNEKGELMNNSTTPDKNKPEPTITPVALPWIFESAVQPSE